MIGEQGYSTLVVQEGGYRVRYARRQCAELLQRPGHGTIVGTAGGACAQSKRCGGADWSP
jgi:hypothetical protein